MPKWELHEDHTHLKDLPSPHGDLHIGGGVFPVRDENGKAVVDVPEKLAGHMRGLGAKRIEDKSSDA